MNLKTEHLLITDFTPRMAHAVHLGSLDAATRRFLPDEVFETEAIAASVISELIDCCSSPEGPYVHPMLTDDIYAGYVQLVKIQDGWEIGYHTVAAHTGKGFATEAVRAFLPVMMEKLHITQVAGICDAENIASIRVLGKCGFQKVYEGEGLYQGSNRRIVKMLFTK